MFFLNCFLGQIINNMSFRIFNEDVIKYPTVITDDQSTATAPEALQLLVNGNKDFASGGPTIVNSSPARVRSLTYTQEPFAAVHSCCDTREPVTSIFKRGVGDIFNIRTAGNNLSGVGTYGSTVNNSTVDNSVIASLEFAILGLDKGPQLFVMMAHTNCGAVSASFNYYTSISPGTSDPPADGTQLPYIVTGIKAASLQAISEGASVERATQYNATNSLNFIRDNSITLNAFMSDSSKLVYGALYDTATGLVEFALYDYSTGLCDWTLRP
jgi:carbonic anhydrase